MNKTGRFLIIRTVLALVLVLGNPSITCFRIVTKIVEEWPCRRAYPVPECMPLAYETCLLHINIVIAMFVKSVGRGGGG